MLSVKNQIEIAEIPDIEAFESFWKREKKKKTALRLDEISTIYMRLWGEKNRFTYFCTTPTSTSQQTCPKDPLRLKAVGDARDQHPVHGFSSRSGAAGRAASRGPGGAPAGVAARAAGGGAGTEDTSE